MDSQEEYEEPKLRKRKKKNKVNPWAIIVKSDQYRMWKAKVKRACDYECKECHLKKKKNKILDWKF